MRTVQKEIAKENKNKVVTRVLDSINAVEKTATLDPRIGCPAYSMKTSGWMKTLSLLGESLKQTLVGLTYV